MNQLVVNSGVCLFCKFCCDTIVALVTVDMYLEFACCAAVPGGGRNKEYALHLLHLCHGNIHVSLYVQLNTFVHSRAAVLKTSRLSLTFFTAHYERKQVVN